MLLIDVPTPISIFILKVLSKLSGSRLIFGAVPKVFLYAGRKFGPAIGKCLLLRDSRAS